MPIRWYSTVIDSRDPQAQARWWAEVLDWQLFYDTPDEAVIIPAYYNEEMARATPWERVGPGLVFVAVPEGKQVKNRLHLDLAPHLDDDRGAEIERLLKMGATRADVGQPEDSSFDVFRVRKATSSACFRRETAEGVTRMPHPATPRRHRVPPRSAERHPPCPARVARSSAGS